VGGFFAGACCLRRPAEKRERTSGKAAGARGRNRTGKKAGARSVSGVLRFLDHPRANSSVQVREAPEQHPQHGGEGKAHTGRSLVAMRRSEDRSQSARTRHIEGMTTGPLQIEPDTRREGPAEH